MIEPNILFMYEGKAKEKTCELPRIQLIHGMGCFLSYFTLKTESLTRLETLGIYLIN